MSSCTLAFLSLICLTLHAGLVLANPQIVANLDVNQGDRAIKGELRFDLAGSKVDGQVDLNLNTDPQSPPKLQGGGQTAGRVKAHIALDGTYRGGQYGGMNGTAKLSGDFTTNSGCQTQMNGVGTFVGTVSAPLGLAKVTADWARIEFSGCNLMSPLPFSIILPTFTFEKTDEIPEPAQQAASIPITTAAAILAIIVAVAILALWKRGILPIGPKTSRKPPATPTTTIGMEASSGPVCPTCGLVNRPGYKFCTRDRTPLTPTRTQPPTPVTPTKFCINCGKQMPLDSRFCASCGSPQ